MLRTTKNGLIFKKTTYFPNFYVGQNTMLSNKMVTKVLHEKGGDKIKSKQKSLYAKATSRSNQQLTAVMNKFI